MRSSWLALNLIYLSSLKLMKIALYWNNSDESHPNPTTNIYPEIKTQILKESNFFNRIKAFFWLEKWKGYSKALLGFSGSSYKATNTANQKAEKKN